MPGLPGGRQFSGTLRVAGLSCGAFTFPKEKDKPQQYQSVLQVPIEGGVRVLLAAGIALGTGKDCGRKNR
jgi:hypothetical protein